jgi:ABC-type phosphate/phosphonate transport system substrate-binding protein
MPVASMPMYDMPEVQGALDSLWAGLVRHLKREGLNEVPSHIHHGRDLADLWNDPDLWFSQCCGYDIVRRFIGKLRPVATPHYGAPECKRGDYASIVVVAEDSEASDVLEMFGAICVVNGLESHSGSNALKGLVAPRNRNGRFFSETKVSGCHVSSLEMIRHGEADVAAIDCVTYALLESYRPTALTGIRKLGRTYRAPAIPYVTRWDDDDDRIERLQAALFNAFSDTHLTSTRQALYLKSIEVLPVSAYQRISEIEDYAAGLGYPELC